MFRSKLKFQIPQLFEKHFPKTSFSRRASADGRPNRRRVFKFLQEALKIFVLLLFGAKKLDICFMMEIINSSN